ncbi:MAG: hypothetical protein KGL39_28185 [Patescibacteria group bacterium]|nr:hypothetical protein [Patescibacteria group bacterium]
MNVTRRAVMAALPVAAVGVSEGCATLQNLFNNPAFLTGLATAIDVAVGVALHSAGPGAAALASALVTAAQDLASVVSGSTVTISSLATTLIDKINADTKLNATLKAALVNIVTLATAALGSEVGKVPANASAELSTVFNDIVAAAQTFLAAASNKQAQAVMLRMGLTR